MNNDLKIYSPEVIEDRPFPQSGASQVVVGSVSDSGPNQIYGPSKIKEQEFPSPKFATELLSSALNTKSRKILQQLEFTKFGAIQIGDFVNGVSGDIRISPSGIVGRNISGVNTFALDADTGDATFQGTVRASTLESNNLLTGIVDVGTPNGNSYVRLDGANNRMVVHDGTTPRIVIGNV